MLLALTQWLAQDVRAFNVFQYISLLAGPLVIRKLTAYKIGQAVRDDGPQSHLTKAGTPTMGGALVLLSILITTLLWGDLTNRFVWFVLVVTVGTSNAVNLTDGLDELAIMPAVMVARGLSVFAMSTGREDYTRYLHFPY